MSRSRKATTSRTSEKSKAGEPILWFPEDRANNDGFATRDVDRENFNDEKVVRELVQNCLDASLPATATGRTASSSVEIELAQWDINDIPHMDEYRRTFEQASEFRRDRGGPPEKRAVERIRSALRKQRVPVLLCTDNGRGIDSEALRALYSRSDTTKVSGTGRGSVGDGHLTAFSVSDLRYILYAGQSTGTIKQATGTTKPVATSHQTGTSNEPDRIFGGHAILATHGNQVSAIGSVTTRSAHGYITCAEDSNGAPDFSVFNASGVQKIPGVLTERMPQTSGSVVAILGYSPMHPDYNASTASKRTGEMLLAAAAKHFWLAVTQGALSLSFRHNGSAVHEVTKDNIGTVLEKVGVEKRRSRWRVIAGARCLRSYETFQDGYTLSELPDGDGVTIWFRKLARNENTRVSLFRDGMWITDELKGLGRRDFSGQNPFDAVIAVDRVPDSDGSMRLDTPCAWVREAEGASHLAVTLEEIADDRTRERLRVWINNIHARLALEAGDRGTELVVPDQLRFFSGAGIRPVPRPRQQARQEDLYIYEEETITAESDSDENVEGGSGSGADATGGGSGDGDGSGDQQGDGEGTDAGDRQVSQPVMNKSPRPGSSSGIRVSCRVRTGDQRVVDVVWSAEEFRSGAAELRVYSPSGSDITCTTPVPRKYRHITPLDATLEPGAAIPTITYTIPVDTTRPQGSMAVRLSDDLDPAVLASLRAEVVHKQPATPETADA